ncbi:MAG TPA: phospholipase D family protein [Candidatus Bathyarchaeia archaeon]|nr:phospholipase D family protein [Candidatus Bathyarchaeia archaeon]
MAIEYIGYLLYGNDGDTIDEIINNGLLKARKYVWISSAKVGDFIVVNDHTKEGEQLSNKIYQMAKRGVKFKFLLAPHEKTKAYKNTQTFYQKLEGVENIEFEFCYDMHMKVILVDGTWMYFGSANLTGAGIGSRSRKGKNNFEVGTITIDQKAIDAIEYQLQQIWNGNECQGCYQKQKGYCKGIE